MTNVPTVHWGQSMVKESTSRLHVEVKGRQGYAHQGHGAGPIDPDENDPRSFARLASAPAGGTCLGWVALMDGSWYRRVNRLADRTTWAHGSFAAYARYGIVLFALLLAVAYLDGRQHDDHRAVAGSVWAAAAAMIALGIGQLIGAAIDRARPYEAMASAHLLVDRTTDFSFPSDHATAVGAVAVGLLVASRRWGVIAAALAVAMAFTRVYVGAHYPSDVLAGLALGAAVAVAGWLIIGAMLVRFTAWIGRTPARPLVTSSPSRVTPRP